MFCHVNWFNFAVKKIRFISSLFRYICLYLIHVASICFLSISFCMQNFLIRVDANTANPWFTILLQFLHFLLFPIYFLGVFVYTEYLCCPSEASTRYCVIPGGYPPQDWWSLPCAGEELNSNPGLLIWSQVRYHWATSSLFHFQIWLLWSEYEGQHKTFIQQWIKPSLGTLHWCFRQPFFFLFMSFSFILLIFPLCSFRYLRLISKSFITQIFFNSLRGE